MGEAVNERMEVIIKLPHPITKILELPSLKAFKERAEVALGDMA